MFSRTPILTHLRRCRWFLLGVALTVTITVDTQAADELTVPVANQVPIFFKLLTYDRGLAEETNGPLRIGVLVQRGNDDSRQCGDDFSATLASMSNKTINGRQFQYETIDWETLPDLSASLKQADLDVLYLTFGHQNHLADVWSITRDLGILSLGSESAFVEAGISIGLGLKSGRPEIWVNLEALHQENHILDARILRLCKVVSVP